VLNTNAKLLNHLSRDSEQLQLLNDQFLPFSDDFEMKYFYETRETVLPGGTSMIVGRFGLVKLFESDMNQIVPKTSAVLPGTKNAESVGIQGDHRNMVRFTSRKSDPYQAVVELLKWSSHDALSFVKDSWRAFDESKG
jgi:hypothetical protein